MFLGIYLAILDRVVGKLLLIPEATGHLTLLNRIEEVVDVDMDRSESLVWGVHFSLDQSFPDAC